MPVVLAVLLALAGCATAPTLSPPVRPPSSGKPPIVPSPPPTAEPTPVPIAPVPSESTGAMPGPEVRILLRRTAATAELPQPGRAYRVIGAGGERWLHGPLILDVVGDHRWQVGAWSSFGAAERAAEVLTEGLPPEAQVLRGRGDDDLVRVWVRWSKDEPADPAAELEHLGYRGAFRVALASKVRITGGDGRELAFPGPVELRPAGEWPTAVGGRRYRGRFEARVVGHELLLVNHLEMESYLKGVVPVEMGPSMFPELEALKAQAVAARTYAVAHLGDHDDEGYDLCATPACQAYHGVGAEHKLSNRAVEDTLDLVALYEGLPIDAMYTSTCSGHTEDAAVLFPDRAQPYLAGTSCSWERPIRLDGAAAEGPWISRGELEQTVVLAALDLDEAAAADPQKVIDRLAVLCGGSAARLGDDSEVDGFVRALLAAAALEEAATELVPGDSVLARLLSLVDLLEMELDPPTGSWRDGWHLAAGLAALRLQGLVVRDRGEAVPHPDGAAIYPRRADRSEPLVMPIPLYEAWQGGYRSRALLDVLPGTNLERWRAGDRLLAVAVRRSGGDGEADRRSAWRSWARERTWSELEQRLGVADLEDLEITARTATGRVVGLVATARDGHRTEWTGFGVRQALRLPESLFTMHRMRRADGTEIIRFLGRGWGHGVGLCQNGSYGLARSGRSFEDILKTYYAGIEIGPWSPAATPVTGAD